VVYFDFRTWFRMLRLAWREQNPGNRRRLLFSLGVTVPVVASLHAVCFLLDPSSFPDYGAREIRTPIFIVGHARSEPRTSSPDERGRQRSAPSGSTALLPVAARSG
jgi:hypothetical protein